MPKLAARMEANVPDGLSDFLLPATHRKNSAPPTDWNASTFFPNEASALRLATRLHRAIMEITEDWETGKIYLQLETM